MTDTEKKTAAEVAIDLLERKADELIRNQNEVPLNTLNAPDKVPKSTQKKSSKIPSVIKSIGVGGTSIFSNEIDRKPDDNELPLH